MCKLIVSTPQNGGDFARPRQPSCCLSKQLPEDRKEAKRSRFLLVMSFQVSKKPGSSQLQLQTQHKLNGEDFLKDFHKNKYIPSIIHHPEKSRSENTLKKNSCFKSPKKNNSWFLGWRFIPNINTVPTLQGPQTAESDNLRSHGCHQDPWIQTSCWMLPDPWQIRIAREGQ